MLDPHPAGSKALGSGLVPDPAESNISGSAVDPDQAGSKNSGSGAPLMLLFGGTNIFYLFRPMSSVIPKCRQSAVFSVYSRYASSSLLMTMDGHPEHTLANRTVEKWVNQTLNKWIEAM